MFHSTNLMQSNKSQLVFDIELVGDGSSDYVRKTGAETLTADKLLNDYHIAPNNITLKQCRLEYQFLMKK